MEDTNIQSATMAHLRFEAEQSNSRHYMFRHYAGMNPSFVESEAHTILEHLFQKKFTSQAQK